jgi:hypothetical protein
MSASIGAAAANGSLSGSTGEREAAVARDEQTSSIDANMTGERSTRAEIPLMLKRRPPHFLFGGPGQGFPWRGGVLPKQLSALELYPIGRRDQPEDFRVTD